MITVSLRVYKLVYAMEKEDLERFSDVLNLKRSALVELLREPSSFATAGPTEVALTLLSEIDSALDRINSGTFGACSECDEGVGLDHIELDFTTSVCLDHYSDAQIAALQRDLELAANVQKSLLPSEVPTVKGLDVSAHLESASFVGGDYYDFFTSAKGDAGFVIADVMGKGLAASMLMSNLQASLRILGPEYEEPHLLANRLNQLFRFNVRLTRFISMFLAYYCDASQRILYANAGHHPPVFRRSSNANVSFLNPTGPALGLVPSPDYKTAEVNVESGDLLLLYTDGLVEVRNASGEEYGEDRLVAFVETSGEKSAHEVLTGLRETVSTFSNGLWSDDVTILTIKVI